MTRPELIRAVKDQGLRSVSAVFGALAGGEKGSVQQTGTCVAVENNLVARTMKASENKRSRIE